MFSEFHLQLCQSTYVWLAKKVIIDINAHIDGIGCDR